MGDTKTIIADTVDNLRRVLQAIHEYSKKAEYATGLTGPQLWAIKVIAERGAICVSDLAARMYLHAATVIGILDRLEKRGLITRLRTRSDRRFVVIELSKQGKLLVEQSPEVAQGIIVKGLEELPVKTLETISRGLEKMVDLLGATAIPPRMMLSPEVNAPARKPGGRPRTQKEAGV
ncbi:MAG: MarR family transcriptional regulator [Deltaproteobacteria bacterium]|nr:MarR family transcriptional regulator [Deltaproteobacteria bacterium]